ncbi:hypothetical protein P154DRAFT_448472, partial [Amniculicola lignicola CBS 123094]
DFLSIYKYIRLALFIEQSIRNSFKVIGLILSYPDYILLLLTIIRTLLLL